MSDIISEKKNNGSHTHTHTFDNLVGLPLYLENLDDFKDIRSDIFAVNL